MNKICAFFGHRDTPATQQVEEMLEGVMYALVNEGVNEFWVCDQGNFDWLSRMVASRIQKQFKNQIYICYICAYPPSKFSKLKLKSLEERYEIDYPDEAANGSPKFAIERRNKYIADKADYIVCYINRRLGGAYKAVQQAIKNGKVVINIANKKENVQ
ncbi:MAG: hypothetical protein J6W11_00435 [Alphaproteobacteria bacterium]|nr:hypothetical protein [Alphaproteobacteria bacterium]